MRARGMAFGVCAPQPFKVLPCDEIGAAERIRTTADCLPAASGVKRCKTNVAAIQPQFRAGVYVS